MASNIVFTDNINKISSEAYINKLFNKLIN